MVADLPVVKVDYYQAWREAEAALRNAQEQVRQQAALIAGLEADLRRYREAADDGRLAPVYVAPEQWSNYQRRRAAEWELELRRREFKRQEVERRLVPLLQAIVVPLSARLTGLSLNDTADELSHCHSS
jgi:hypothetical protein